MYDNPYLDQGVKSALEDAYAGTEIGDQELYGRLLDEIQNALWRRESLAHGRITPEELPDTVRITVGVDPSGGAGEQGIVVTAKSGLVLPGMFPVPEGMTVAPRAQAHGFVLDDRTCRLQPEGWGERAVRAAVDWEADDICVEVNYGGDQAVAVLRTACERMGVSIPLKQVRATRGKVIRAQPVAALAAQGRMHHVGTFPELEDQLCTWYPELGWSPDRLDACLAAGTMVTTHRGLVPIEQVTTDDWAWTRAGWRRVVWSGMTSSSADVMHVVTTHGEFTATPDHKVWTEQKGFIRVDAMVWGDRLNTSTGQFRQRAQPRVERIYAIETRQPVYDLTIEGEHEFYANGILVHNCVWGPWHMRLVQAVSSGQGSIASAAAGRKIG
jgi:hypothetical protein